MPTTSLPRTLNVSAAAVGFVGAVMLAKGVLFSDAGVIAEQVATKSDFNEELLIGLAGQRGDYIVGVVFILLAFVIQMLALVVQWTDMMLSRRSLIALTIAIVLALLFIGYWASGAIAQREKRWAGDHLTRRLFADAMRDKRINRHEAEGIIQYGAKFLPTLAHAPADTRQARVRRIAEYLALPIPNETDWSDAEGKIQ